MSGPRDAGTIAAVMAAVQAYLAEEEDAAGALKPEWDRRLSAWKTVPWQPIRGSIPLRTVGGSARLASSIYGAEAREVN